MTRKLNNPSMNQCFGCYYQNQFGKCTHIGGSRDFRDPFGFCTVKRTGKKGNIKAYQVKIEQHSVSDFWSDPERIELMRAYIKNQGLCGTVPKEYNCPNCGVEVGVIDHLETVLCKCNTLLRVKGGCLYTATNHPIDT